MPKKTLALNLERLHEELSTLDSLDDETRESLAEIAADIERILGQQDPRHASLPDRIEVLTVRFEASHPKLAGVLSEVADALAKVGI